MDFNFLVAEGMIAPQDVKLVETAEQAIAALLDLYQGQPPDMWQDNPKGIA